MASCLHDDHGRVMRGGHVRHGLPRVVLHVVRVHEAARGDGEQAAGQHDDTRGRPRTRTRQLADAAPLARHAVIPRQEISSGARGRDLEVVPSSKTTIS